MIYYSQSPPKLWITGLRGDPATCDKLDYGPKLSHPVYSGAGEGLNNPDMEDVKRIGPIPKGLYRIPLWLPKHPSKGPIVARLVPVDHDARGRTGFLIHGDNSTPAPNDGSWGCIVAPRSTREWLRGSGEQQLTVL